MTLKLDTLTLEQCQQVRLWRNECLEALRTPYALTEEQQQQFFCKVVRNRHSPHRYWAVMNGDKFIGMGGLTFIQWDNRLAEISLILDPQCRDQGYGKEAVALILDRAFGLMGLKTVIGECYWCSGAMYFWRAIGDQYHVFSTTLPNRKFWKGRFYGSTYFSIDVEDWRKVTDA